MRKPVTVTGECSSTSSSSLFPRRPRSEGMFSAYPPFFSWSTTEISFACQSEKIDSMYVRQSSSPSISSDAYPIAFCCS
jgi:hypothetical protein